MFYADSNQAAINAVLNMQSAHANHAWRRCSPTLLKRLTQDNNSELTFFVLPKPTEERLTTGTMFSPQIEIELGQKPLHFVFGAMNGNREVIYPSEHLFFRAGVQDWLHILPSQFREGGEATLLSFDQGFDLAAAICETPNEAKREILTPSIRHRSGLGSS